MAIKIAMYKIKVTIVIVSTVVKYPCFILWVGSALICAFQNKFQQKLHNKVSLCNTSCSMWHHLPIILYFVYA